VIEPQRSRDINSQPRVGGDRRTVAFALKSADLTSVAFDSVEIRRTNGNGGSEGCCGRTDGLGKEFRFARLSMCVVRMPHIGGKGGNLSGLLSLFGSEAEQTIVDEMVHKLEHSGFMFIELECPSSSDDFGKSGKWWNLPFERNRTKINSTSNSTLSENSHLNRLKVSREESKDVTFVKQFDFIVDLRQLLALNVIRDEYCVVFRSFTRLLRIQCSDVSDPPNGAIDCKGNFPKRQYSHSCNCNDEILVQTSSLASAVVGFEYYGLPLETKLDADPEEWSSFLFRERLLSLSKVQGTTLKDKCNLGSIFYTVQCLHTNYLIAVYGKNSQIRINFKYPRFDFCLEKISIECLRSILGPCQSAARKFKEDSENDSINITRMFRSIIEKFESAHMKIQLVMNFQKRKGSDLEVMADANTLRFVGTLRHVSKPGLSNTTALPGLNHVSRIDKTTPFTFLLLAKFKYDVPLQLDMIRYEEGEVEEIPVDVGLFRDRRWGTSRGQQYVGMGRPRGFVGDEEVKAWRVMLDRESFLSHDDINNTLRRIARLVVVENQPKQTVVIKILLYYEVILGSPYIESTRYDSTAEDKINCFLHPQPKSRLRNNESSFDENASAKRCVSSIRKATNRELPRIVASQTVGKEESFERQALRCRPFGPPNEPDTSDCSERGYVVGAQGLDSEVTRESEASMPNEGLSAAKGALAEGRYTSAPSQRPQDSTQTVLVKSRNVFVQSSKPPWPLFYTNKDEYDVIYLCTVVKIVRRTSEANLLIVIALHGLNEKQPKIGPAPNALNSNSRRKFYPENRLMMKRSLDSPRGRLGADQRDCCTRHENSYIQTSVLQSIPCRPARPENIGSDILVLTLIVNSLLKTLLRSYPNGKLLWNSSGPFAHCRVDRCQLQIPFRLARRTCAEICAETTREHSERFNPFCRGPNVKDTRDPSGFEGPPTVSQETSDSVDLHQPDKASSEFRKLDTSERLRINFVDAEPRNLDLGPPCDTISRRISIQDSAPRLSQPSDRALVESTATRQRNTHTIGAVAIPGMRNTPIDSQAEIFIIERCDRSVPDNATPPRESRDPNQPIANFRCIGVAPEEARFSGLPPLKSLSVIKPFVQTRDWEATAAWPRQEQPCPIAGDFCMNGGTCLFFETVGEPACRCFKLKYKSLYSFSLAISIIDEHYTYCVNCYSHLWPDCGSTYLIHSYIFHATFEFLPNVRKFAICIVDLYKWGVLSFSQENMRRSLYFSSKVRCKLRQTSNMKKTEKYPKVSRDYHTQIRDEHQPQLSQHPGDERFRDAPRILIQHNFDLKAFVENVVGNIIGHAPPEDASTPERNDEPNHSEQKRNVFYDILRIKGNDRKSNVASYSPSRIFHALPSKVI
ncbi:hypothetical protein WN51_05764, partial [Melipona quadrifasciata]